MAEDELELDTLGDRKSALFVILSDTDSTFNFVMDEDFQIGIQMDNFYERFPTIIQNNPLSDELMGQITDIPGVQKIILDECVMGRLVESAVNYTSLEDNLELLNSLSPELIANVSEIVSGTVSYDDLGTNEIVINKYRTDRSELNYGDLQVGDSLTFRFEVGGQTISWTDWDPRRLQGN